MKWSCNFRQFFHVTRQLDRWVKLKEKHVQNTYAQGRHIMLQNANYTRTIYMYHKPILKYISLQMLYII